MGETGQRSIDVQAQVAELEQALGAERAEYERLLELAQRQTRLMTSGDTDAVAAGAAELASGLVAADGLRQQRERLAARLMAISGDGEQRLSSWLARQPEHLRGRLGAEVQQVREVGTRLLRANEKNRRLASFCLDLVEEEADVRRHALSEDPSGRYDRAAHPTTEGAGRMVQKQA